MSPLRKRFSEDLKLAGYSKRTQESYIYSVSKLAQYWSKSPENISNEELRQYLLFHMLRYRALFTLIYSCGLRLREATTLKVYNIDSQRMTVKVENGKGGYDDRYIPLPYATLDLLRAYYRTHGNPILLFPGPGQGEKNEPVSKHTISKNNTKYHGCPNIFKVEVRMSKS